MNPYWINANGLRLAIVPRPRGWDWLADDIAALRSAGIDVLLSALTPAEIDELAFCQPKWLNVVVSGVTSLTFRLKIDRYRHPRLHSNETLNSLAYSF